MESMQNTDLFEGDIVGIPAEASFRRMHDDVDDVARIFGQPVSDFLILKHRFFSFIVL